MGRRRNLLSFSLRTLLIVLTGSSIGFAWFLHHRAAKVRERDRIVELMGGHQSHVNFRYTLLGWEVPPESGWLRRVAIPAPEVMFLRADGMKPLPKEFCEIARRCSTVEYGGADGGNDAYLRESVSARTEVIKITRNGVSNDCLEFAGECTNLREVEVRYVSLSSKSMDALLNHPRIERLDVHADAEQLSLLGELRGANALQRLQLHLDRDWRQSSAPVLGASFSGVPTGLPTPRLGDTSGTGDFVWLKQCSNLRELTLAMPQDAKFVILVGKHLGGVERLNIGAGDPPILDALVTWKKLRHLCLDGSSISDDKLAKIVTLCPDLHTLEVDEYSGTGDRVTPAGLRKLQELKALKRLRLGKCNLKRGHMAAIAESSQLEELSFEGNEITDETVEPLNRLPQLRRISLERTSATGNELRATRGDWDDNRPYRT